VLAWLVAVWSAVAVLALSFGGVAQAQDESENRASGAGPSSVALLDVKLLLEHNAALRRRQEQIEAGAALAEALVRQRRREIDELAKRLKALVAGSAEHTELDLKITRWTAELDAQVDQARRKLAAERARAQVEAYREIVRAVNEYLEESDFRIVLRTSAAYPKNASHRPVVFAIRGVDITPEILRRLNDGRPLRR
jgi:Skp family chaperone for outer membrane proteins